MNTIGIATLALLFAQLCLADPTLLYFSKGSQECRWNFFLPKSGETRRYLTTKRCPSLLAWDQKNGRTVYTVGNSLFSHVWGKPGSEISKPIPLPYKGPNDPEERSGESLTVTRTGKVRYAHLEVVPPQDVIREGGKNFFQFGSKRLDAGYFSEDGMPYVAVVDELVESGKWKRVVERATNWAAGDTAGLSVVNDEMQSQEPLKITPPIEAWPSQAAPKTPADLRKCVDSEIRSGEEGLGFLKWKEGVGLLFPIVMGDTQHIGAPIVLCQNGCEKRTPLEGIESRVDPSAFLYRITFDGDYALVAEERNLGAKIYRYDSPKSVVSFYQEPVSWFPFPDDVQRIAFPESKGDRTEVLDPKQKELLLGDHKLTIQWVAGKAGTATVAEKDGILRVSGEQFDASKENGVSLEGTITRIDATTFDFAGKISILLKGENDNRPCVKTEPMTFKRTGKRKFWRLQQMQSRCSNTTDYVDIFLR